MPYQFEGRVRYSEVDERQRMTLPALIDYFQDCSSFQAEDLGIGSTFLNQNHLAWMIVFWQIDLIRLPMLGETVAAQTWPYGFKGFYGLRNFRLLDVEGKALANANSVWVLMDTEKLRPGRVSDHMKELYLTEPKLDMEYLPRKIAEPEQAQAGDEILVTRSHLDTNHHVNNGQFFRIAQQYLPDDFSVSRICVEYRSQAHLHDRIIPRVSPGDSQYVVSLDNPEQEPYCIVSFSRQK